MDEEISLFIRYCWNRHFSASQFISEVHEKYDNEGIKNITNKLLELYGIESQNSRIFLEYLVVIVKEDPSYIFDLVPTILQSNEKISSCIHLFILCGDSLFNNLPIGKPESAECAINILKIVLSFPNDQKSIKLIRETISKLTFSPKFSILISSGRVLARDLFLEVRHQFEFADPYRDKTKSIPLTQSYLLTALFTQNIGYTQVLHYQHDLIIFFSSSIQFWKRKSGFFSFFIPSFAYIIYFLFINHYAECPSLQLAFMITNLCPNVFDYDRDSNNGLDNNFGNNDNDDKKQTNNENNENNENNNENSIFNEKKLIDLLGKINENSRTFFDNPHPSSYSELMAPRFKKEYWEFFPNDRSIKLFSNLLTSKPAEFSYKDICRTALQYPLFVSEISKIIIKSFEERNVEKSIELADSVLERIEEFQFLLTIQAHLSEFLFSLSEFVVTVTDSKSFSKLWFLFLSIFYCSWRDGSKYLRNFCNKFEEKASPLIKLYLYLFSGRITAQEYSSNFSFLELDQIKQLNSPFEICLHYQNYLIQKDDISSESSKDFFLENEYLWSVALVWGIRVRHKNAFKISHFQIPKYEIVNILLSQMMIVLTKPKNAWQAFIDMQDLDFLTEFKPRFISEIQHRIIFDLNNVSKAETIDPITVQYISTMWRAWIIVFTFNTFAESLISLLIWNSRNPYNMQTIIKIFQAAACFLINAIDDDYDSLIQIIKLCIKMLNEENLSTAGCVGLAQICIIIVISLQDNWQEAFDLLLEVKNKAVSDEFSYNSSTMTFVMTIVKASLYFLNMQSIVSPDMFDSNFLKHDCQTAIDYYIAKELREYPK